MLNVVFSYCYAEGCDAECHYAVCRYAECCYAESRGTLDGTTYLRLKAY
jgi:hypothetical protein